MVATRSGFSPASPVNTETKNKAHRRRFIVL
jgi:hypothetical protein